MDSPIHSFEEFWPQYVSAHRNPVNRALHYVGFTAAIGTVATAAATLNPAWLLLTPVVGYGPAWVGHFVFEHNTPATFKHPWWSLRGDVKMYLLALQGKMGAELARVAAAPEGKAHDHAGASTNGVTAATAAG